MPGRKRKTPAAAAAAGEQPSAKQPKLSSTKRQRRQDDGKQQSSGETGGKFNIKRLRFISDTEKMKQGSKGVLYWMSRDQRVQGNSHIRTQEKMWHAPHDSSVS